MTDEARWGVGGRIGALGTLDTTSRNNGVLKEAVVYYPGAGTDVMNPLFATASTSRYFIFVDPSNDITAMLGSAIHEQGKSRLNDLERAPILQTLNIASRATDGWMFNLKGKQRFLLWFKTGNDTFLQNNPLFSCDFFFDKDFWETDTDVDLQGVLDHLNVHGCYSTNASIGAMTVWLGQMGLRHLRTVNLNGEQYLYLRDRVTNLGWAQVKQALTRTLSAFAFLTADNGPLDPVRDNGPLPPIQVTDAFREAKERAISILSQSGFQLSAPEKTLGARQALERFLGAMAPHCSNELNAAF